MLVVLDTVRADALGCYGAVPDPAPLLTRLAARGTVFESAFSTSSWTAPASASIFTGWYPLRHGVTAGFRAHARGERRARRREREERIELHRIPKLAKTLPEQLRAAGYATFGISTNINVGSEIGFDRGFNRFVRRRSADSEVVLRVLERWLPEIRAASPFFVYLHLNDAHQPYEQRAGFAATGTREGDLRAGYESEIRFMDRHLAHMLAALDPESRALLVVVSDHGEEFFERGQRGHGMSLHAELHRAVFLVAGPDVAAQRIEASVSLVDVLPTILDRVGETPESGSDGRSLLPLLGAGAPDPLHDELGRRPVYAHRASSLHPRRQLEAIVQGRFKLVAGAGAAQLYDTRDDPGEVDDAAGRDPERTAALQNELESMRAAQRRAAPPAPERISVAIDAERRAELEALGYVENADTPDLR